MKLSLSLLLLIAVAAIAAPLLAPFDPSAQLDVVGLKNHPPSAAHWLGTDPFSRDVLSRLLHGARTSITVALTATLVALAAGAVWGALAHGLGASGGAWLLTLADAARSVPRLLILLCASAVVGRWVPQSLAILVGVTASPIICRVVHARLATLSVRPFIEAAGALGVSRGRILWRHLLPHVMDPLVATGVLLLAEVMVLESSLSFLGLGVRAPGISWGTMVQEALPFIGSAWWVAAVPSVCLLLTVACTAHLADALSLQSNRDVEA